MTLENGYEKRRWSSTADNDIRIADVWHFNNDHAPFTGSTCCEIRSICFLEKFTYNKLKENKLWRLHNRMRVGQLLVTYKASVPFSQGQQIKLMSSVRSSFFSSRNRHNRKLGPSDIARITNSLNRCGTFSTVESRNIKSIVQENGSKSPGIGKLPYRKTRIACATIAKRTGVISVRIRHVGVTCFTTSHCRCLFFLSSSSRVHQHRHTVLITLIKETNWVAVGSKSANWLTLSRVHWKMPIWNQWPSQLNWSHPVVCLFLFDVKSGFRSGSSLTHFPTMNA